MYFEKVYVGKDTSLIAGDGGGIGPADAKALAEAGDKVKVFDVSEPVLAPGQKGLAAKEFAALTIVLGVTEPIAVWSIAEATTRSFGKIDVDLNGCFWSYPNFDRRFVASIGNLIVTRGSMSGFFSNKPQGRVHCDTSDAGVHHVTR